MAEAIKVPAAPTSKRVVFVAGNPVSEIVQLPKNLAARWQQAWSDAFDQAKNDESEGGEAMWSAIALREANKTLRFPDPKDYAAAMALQDWQFVARTEKDGTLTVVTRHGKKLRFTVPAKSAGANASQDGNGNGAGGAKDDRDKK